MTATHTGVRSTRWLWIAAMWGAGTLFEASQPGLFMPSASNTHGLIFLRQRWHPGCRGSGCPTRHRLGTAIQNHSRHDHPKGRRTRWPAYWIASLGAVYLIGRTAYGAPKCANPRRAALGTMSMLPTIVLDILALLRIIFADNASANSLTEVHYFFAELGARMPYHAASPDT